MLLLRLTIVTLFLSSVLYVHFVMRASPYGVDKHTKQQSHTFTPLFVEHVRMNVSWQVSIRLAASAVCGC